MKDRIEKFKKEFHLQSFVVGICGILFIGITLLVFDVDVSKLGGSIGLAGSGNFNSVSQEGASEIMKEFVENNLVAKGVQVEIKNIELEEDMGLYRVTMQVGENERVSYLSRDGNNFVEKVFPLDDVRKKRMEQELLAKAKNTKAPKSDKPKVEVFVMSYCPYGTQIQKGFLPVIETLKEEANIQFKFVDYLMHNKIELTENLNQHCIATNQSVDYLKYLGCFLKTGKSSECMDQVGISKGKVAACVKVTDDKFGMSADFEDTSTWKGKFPRFSLHEEENQDYDVKGSPTIVINGTVVESNRDPSSLLETVCSAFSEKPEACETELSTVAPSAGFGDGQGSANPNAGCES